MVNDGCMEFHLIDSSKLPKVILAWWRIKSAWWRMMKCIEMPEIWVKSYSEKNYCNIAPTKRPGPKRNPHLPTPEFQVLCQFQGGYQPKIRKWEFAMWSGRILVLVENWGYPAVSCFSDTPNNLSKKFNFSRKAMEFYDIECRNMPDPRSE